jgi:uncharacterized membrane protein
MAVDTFVAYGGVYSDLAHAEADYQLVKDLHTQAGLLDAYDAVVIQRRADGKVKIVKQHETPTRVGGAVLGAVAGHVVAGMSRGDLKELGEHLDAGQAGLVVVGISDMGARIEQAMQHADKLQAKELKADTAEIERDAKAAGQAPASD